MVKDDKLFDWMEDSDEEVKEKVKCEFCGREYVNIEAHKKKCKKNPDNSIVLEKETFPKAPKTDVLDALPDLRDMVREIIKEELAKTPKLTGLTEHDIESLEEAIRTAEGAYKNKKNVGVKKFIIHARKVLEEKIKR